MVSILDGKKLAGEIEQRLKGEIDFGTSVAGRSPGLAVVRVGDDPASEVYVANKEKACSRVGIKSFVYHFKKNSSPQKLISHVEDLNSNNNIDGILLQLPLPNGLDEAPILQAISPQKDVDGLHPFNLGKLLKGEPGPRSCTPAGVMALLRRNNISLEGKRSVVVGRSILVGKPMALMLQAANATVTVAHSKTRNLSELTNQADILIVAMGKPQMIGSDYVSPNTVVVDVGIHRVEIKSTNKDVVSSKLCGDVCTKEIDSKASFITPVPGGVGPMTVSMLLVNTVIGWQHHCGLSLTLGDLLP